MNVLLQEREAGDLEKMTPAEYDMFTQFCTQAHQPAFTNTKQQHFQTLSDLELAHEPELKLSLELEPELSLELELELGLFRNRISKHSAHRQRARHRHQSTTEEASQG